MTILDFLSLEDSAYVFGFYKQYNTGLGVVISLHRVFFVLFLFLGIMQDGTLCMRSGWDSNWLIYQFTMQMQVISMDSDALFPSMLLLLVK